MVILQLIIILNNRINFKATENWKLLNYWHFIITFGNSFLVGGNDCLIIMKALSSFFGIVFVLIFNEMQLQLYMRFKKKFILTMIFSTLCFVLKYFNI